MKTFRQKLEQLIQGYVTDPADNEFQRGYELCLKEMHKLHVKLYGEKNPLPKWLDGKMEELSEKSQNVKAEIKTTREDRTNLFTEAAALDGAYHAYGDVKKWIESHGEM